MTSTIVLRTVGLQPQELLLQPAAHDRVDGGERLVHQQHHRVGGERPGHPDPLALAAGELVRVAAAEPGRVEPDQVEQLVDAGPDPRLAASRAGAARWPTLVRTVWCGKSPTFWMT